MHNQLLVTDDIKRSLEASLSLAASSVLIFSAYITSAGLRWLATQLPKDIDCTLVTRWAPEDLLHGASDTHAYEIARENKWGFYIHSRLHGKIVLIDHHELYVGSSNLTANGIGLRADANMEFGLKVSASSQDVKIIEDVFEQARQLDDEAFDLIVSWVQDHDLTYPREFLEWPFNIKAMLDPVRSLQISSNDIPWLRMQELCTVLNDGAVQIESLENAEKHDILLLELPLQFGQAVDEERLINRFKQTAGFLWIVKQLKEEPSHEMLFGRLTELLHEALTHENLRRREVKRLLDNLLSYLTRIDDPDLELFPLNRTWGIRLVL